jgi:hypothetical protein
MYQQVDRIKRVWTESLGSFSSSLPRIHCVPQLHQHSSIESIICYNFGFLISTAIRYTLFQITSDTPCFRLHQIHPVSDYIRYTLFQSRISKSQGQELRHFMNATLSICERMIMKIMCNKLSMYNRIKAKYFI